MSRNPVLSDKAFGETPTAQSSSPAQEWQSAQQGTGTAALEGQTQRGNTAASPTSPGRVMTLGGVSAATLFIFAFLLIGAAYGWTLVTQGAPVLRPDGSSTTPVSFDNPGLLLVCMFGAFGIAMLTVFKPKFARFTALPYGLLEGALLGMISHFYNARFDGIVVQAILATFGVFLAMLTMYGLRILRATPKFTKGVIGATFGIMIMYLLGFVLSLFTNLQPPWQGGGLLSIGISVVIVIVAALNLILDFDFIERGSKNNLPAYMDWYAAFGLILTLVWLYLEMLRLLSKVRQ